MCTLVANGNFKQDHLRMKHPHEDVALSDGHGYMVGKDAFASYIASAPPLSKPVRSRYQIASQHCLIHVVLKKSTCHEHNAVINQNTNRAHLDATGIGAVACGRHGCFYPHAVVNFDKGEG